jgi:GPH family glycoside/pentoside/hexuronide:cation symporter
MSQLPASVRHGYGLGALGLAVANTSVMFFLLKFLVDEAGMSPGWAGTVLMIGKAWDAVTDPVVGRLTDKTKTPMGARRPWILVGAVPFAVTFAALWYGVPVTGMAQVALYTALLIVFDAAYTAVVVPYGALTPALTDDYDERTRLNGARMGWSMAGGILAGVGMPVLLEVTGSFRYAGAALGLVMLPPLFAAVWATAGRDRPVEVENELPMWSVLKNRAFRRVTALFLCAWSSIAALSSLVPFFVEHHLHHPELLDLVFASLQLSALAFVPLVVWVSGRVEKHVAYAVAIGSWGLVLCGLAAIPEGTGYGALAIAALAGPGIAAAHVLPWSMLPDVIETDTAEHGVERAGAFYGVMTFLEKCGTAGALWVLGLALQVAGYAEGAAAQPESARLTILALIGPVPAVVLLCAAAAAIAWPPVTREAHRAVVAQLRAARA